MPIRNSGTVLENIVLVESARLGFEKSSDTSIPVEFVNSFAMPPLSVWKTHTNDKCMNQSRLSSLLEFKQFPEHYEGLLRTCLLPEPVLGPNGALLVALLARRINRPLKMWLNDIDEGERYPESIDGLKGLVSTLGSMEPDRNSPLDVVVCETPFPRSLESLKQTLSGWNTTGSPHIRIAFLDPDRYRIEPRKPVKGGKGVPETCSEDHRLWLKQVSTGVQNLVIAVHFTGHNAWNHLKPELAQLRRDAEVVGYQFSVTFSHSHYTTTTSIWAGDGIDAFRIGQELKERVSRAWQRWIVNTGGGECTLGIDTAL